MTWHLRYFFVTKMNYEKAKQLHIITWEYSRVIAAIHDYAKDDGEDSFTFHLQLFIHEKNPSAINIKNLLTNLNLEIKFLKSLKSYIPNLLLFQGVVF